jgi:hypothetical protein
LSRTIVMNSALKPEVIPERLLPVSRLLPGGE